MNDSQIFHALEGITLFSILLALITNSLIPYAVSLRVRLGLEKLVEWAFTFTITTFIFIVALRLWQH